MSDFPIPKQRDPGPVFKPGDSVIVTTSCEDVELHELTGKVSTISERTGSVIVQLDVDDSKLPFTRHEIGHRY